MGGKVWWREIEISGGFQLQQNLISKHFRILDNQDRRWCSSFNEEYMKKRLHKLSQQ